MTAPTAARWEALPAASGGQALVGLDPYLALADALGYADHGGAATDAPWPVSVEVNSASYRPSDLTGLQLRAAHAGSTHFTALATRQAMARLAQDPQVRRLQWAAAQVPRRPWPVLPGPEAVPGPAAANADGRRPCNVLLGVIDDGCPFAHPALLRADGHTLRLLRLWNQDPAARSASGPPVGFDHGAEFTRGDLQQLRERFSHHGVVNPAACYAAAGMPRLRHEASHGAHVLGLLAGRQRTQGRLTLPGWMAAQAASGGTPDPDIAFVQLPSSVLHSVSVPALEHLAYDGLRYLCQLAVAQGYAHLVVVLAVESWLGPHDGSSWFESAVDHLLDPGRQVGAAMKGLQVQLMMPAGNSRERAVHAQLKLNDTLHWQQPPGNEDPSFIELWAPAGATDLQLRLTPPGGEPSPWVGWGEAANWASHAGSQACVLMPPANALHGGRRQAVLRIAPTSTVVAGSKAPHGRWRLDLQGRQGAPADVHLRIGRVEPAVPVPRRNQQPHIVQRTPEQANADRLHTLNGHACGQRVKVVGAALDAAYPYAEQPALDNRGQPRRHLVEGVAAGRSRLRGRSAAYSGSGPTEGPRRGPDLSVPVEDGGLWPGVLALGPASAAQFRLSGSSTAAPLAARAAAAALLKPKKEVLPDPQPKAAAPDDPAAGTWVARV